MKPTAMCDSERELVEVLGLAATVAFADEYAGTRLYVPNAVDDEHRIARAIGRQAADALCERFGPDTIRVPLMRELRALHYRGEGLSNGRIAVRLGLTETGVEKLFKRLRSASEAP